MALDHRFSLLLVLASLAGACQKPLPVEDPPPAREAASEQLPVPVPVPVAADAAAGQHVAEADHDHCELCEVYDASRTYVVSIVSGSNQGAGILVTEDGLVATNAHVVLDAPEVEVEDSEGGVYRGRVVRRDRDRDLALVQIMSKKRTWFVPDLRDHRALVGEEVYVVGHPLGLGWTISRGIVSALRRQGEVGPMPMIQTDAAISPGSSGGPLLDAEGHILGMVTAKIVAEGSENLAFALPTYALQEFLELVPRDRDM